MVQNTLGVVLAYYRSKYGISLEQMSEGICSVSTLYRIEGGTREVDSLMAETLLGRIGREGTFFELIINNEDYERAMVRKYIVTLIQEKKLEAAKEQLEQYKTLKEKDKNLHKQYILYQELRIALEEHKEKETLCRLAKEGLAYTKDVSQGWQEYSMYNAKELFFVKNLILHSDDFPEDRIIFIFRKMIEYAKCYYNGEAENQCLIELYVDLVQYNYEKRRYEEAILYMEEALEVLSQGRWMLEAGILHELKGRCLLELMQKVTDSKEKAKQCKQEWKLAYYVYDIMKQKKKAEQIKAEAMEVFSWDITGLGIS